MKRTLSILLSSMLLGSCAPEGPEYTRITARAIEPTIDIDPGEYALGLGGFKLVNGSVEWKDGYLYVPTAASGEERLPLLIWMHGGGGNAESARYMFPIAEQYGVAVLALDARHNTWDGIDNPYTRDVPFINDALTHTFERVRIDPQKIALGGLSDGAAYALAIGRSNGQFFTHLAAVAPGLLKPPSPPVGRPKILVAHGERDTVYPAMLSRKLIVPRLTSDGYEVTYFEFDGPHWATDAVVHKIMNWLLAP